MISDLLQQQCSWKRMCRAAVARYGDPLQHQGKALAARKSLPGHGSPTVMARAMPPRVAGDFLCLG